MHGKTSDTKNEIMIFFKKDDSSKINSFDKDKSFHNSLKL